MNMLTLPVSTIEKVERKLKSALEEVRALKRKQKKTGQEEPSGYLIKTLKQAEKNRKEGKGSPVFDNAEDAIAYLEKQGI